MSLMISFELIMHPRYLYVYLNLIPILDESIYLKKLNDCSLLILSYYSANMFEISLKLFLFIPLSIISSVKPMNSIY